MVNQGVPGLIEVSSRDGWSSAGWDKRSGVMFKVPGIALDPDSPEAFHPLEQSSCKGFPAVNILLQKKDIAVNIQTRGDHSQFNYHRGLRPSPRSKVTQSGYGRIKLHGENYFLVSPTAAKGLEQQIVQGTLSTVSRMVEAWSAAAGIEIKPWSKEVMDVRALVERRASHTPACRQAGFSVHHLYIGVPNEYARSRKSILFYLLTIKHMAPTKIVRPQIKGMITIPVEFRQKLAIDENSLLEASMTDNGVLFTKIDYDKKEPEIYSDEQIKKWLKEDALDEKTAKKIKSLLS